MPQSTIRTEITEFETKVATTFAGFATADSVSQAGLQSNLTRAGITAKITATCDHLKIEVQVPEAPGVPTGTDPADLKDAAKDRYAAAYLQKRRAAVWTAIKGLVGGSLKAEQAVEALRALGYGDASMPSTKATVHATIARGRNEGYDDVTFTLPGEGHTVESVTEALISAGAKINPAESLVMSAFADAVLPAERQPVRNVSVESKLTWPAKSEFHS